MNDRQEFSAGLTDDLDAVIEQSHKALDAFVKGDSEPYEALYSHHADVSIANPFGPPAVGWEQAAAAMDRAATNWREGRATGFDRVTGFVTPSLAAIVEMEHYEVKLGGSQNLMPVNLRVTIVFRPEDGTWKIVHRHADPISSARSAEDVITD